ncbi:hypothetical protein Tco_1183166 [Tanacetum coccineum]
MFSNLPHSHSLNCMDRETLERQVTLEEIKETVWDCGSSKAPGPDGYSFAFVKKYWGTIPERIYTCLNLLESFLFFIKIGCPPTSEFSIKRGLARRSNILLFLFLLGYEDDVIITTDWNAKDMDNIIRVLHVFYLASGLKINIHKSNIYGIGVNKDEVLSMASNAGCMAGDVPFNYLGLPTLVPYMNVYCIAEDAFLKLSNLCSSSKCVGEVTFFPKRPLGSVINAFMVKKGFSIQMVVAQGHLGLTLLERYLGLRDSLFYNWYNRLYHLDQDKDCLIIDRINNGQWSWNWSRTNLGVRNLAYLCDMLNEIGQLNIDVNEDTCTWSLGRNGTFTVKDARYRIDQNILPTLAHTTTWDKSIPRKVNVFMWRLSYGRLSS